MEITNRQDFDEDQEIITLSEYPSHQPVVQKGLTDEQVIDLLTNQGWGDSEKSWVELIAEL